MQFFGVDGKLFPIGGLGHPKKGGGYIQRYLKIKSVTFMDVILKYLIETK